MLSEGTILIINAEDGDIVERHLVLWVDPEQKSIATLNLSIKTSWPALQAMETWEELLHSGSAQIDGRSGPDRILFEGHISENDRTIRDKNWGYIANLVSQVPQICVPSLRRALLSEAVTEYGVYRSTIVAALQRYWRRGGCRNALLPDYYKCGGKEKTRNCGEEKRGRPRKNRHRSGVNITPDLATKMQRTAKAVFGGSRSSKTIVKAYNHFIDNECMVRHKDPVTGLDQMVFKEEYLKAGAPSLEQFKYWAFKPHLRVQYQRKRRNLHYERNSRALLGTATSRTIGPGSRYEIDATIADIYLVSEIDRAPIMRPTVYFITDVFTRLIVAVTVTLEPPCWRAAMAALMTAAGDKVEYCKRYGIDIKPEEWPASGLPSILLHDGGELTARWADTLISNFNVRFEKASAFRPDWKGLVEGTFNVRARAITEDEPGSIPNEYQKIRGGDHRVKATLSLKEFTQMMILDVLEFNNTHELVKYDADRDVLADSVPFIPVELWHWGAVNRCQPRNYSIDQVRAALLPHGKASVTREGIKFKSLYYSCTLADDEKWFDQASLIGSYNVTVHFDDRYTDEVYLQHSTGGLTSFIKLTVLPRSRGYDDCSFWDAEDKNERAKAPKEDRKHANTPKKATYRAHRDKIKMQAAKDTRAVRSKDYDPSLSKNIFANSAVEKELERRANNPSSSQESTDTFPPKPKAAPPVSETRVRPSISAKKLRGIK
jgi:Mu transposase, C-terminal